MQWASAYLHRGWGGRWRRGWGRCGGVRHAKVTNVEPRLLPRREMSGAGATLKLLVLDVRTAHGHTTRGGQDT
eukprot:97494-Prymnesium_polylepis.1